MSMSARDPIDDVETLKALLLAERARVSERDALLVQRDARLAKQDTRIVELEHKLSVWAKWIWGPRTEKRAAVSDPASTAAERQKWLPFADLLDAAQRLADKHGVHGSITIEAKKSDTPRAARGRRRSEFPEHLPRVRTTIEVPEAERMCCQAPMEPMGFELRKELERIEVAVVHEIARTKYCCRICQMQVLTAPSPTRVIEKGLLSSNWIASLIVERFGNHMPYHRLEKKYESEGLALSRTVLCRSTLAVAESFAKVHEALRLEIVKGDVAFADETSARVQESKGGPSKKVWMWLFANKVGDQYFDYNESRGGDSPERVLKEFEGYLHSDGYCIYETALDPARIRLVACWVHVRRKFDESTAKDPVFANEALDWIARLFAIDRGAKEGGLSPDELKTLRDAEAPALLSGFREWLDVRKTQVLPESGIGKAIGYALGRWEALCRFLEDGRLELDNNRSERAVRPVAVGRKNWMIIGNERGGRTAAVFYSLVGTCKARGLDPKVYLHDVMLRLAEGEDPATLTPREWQARYGAEVAKRRADVLQQIVGKLGA
jgi:transposase